MLQDHSVLFRIKAPDAQKVQIDLGKKYDMTKDADGFWKVTTDPQGEGFHYYSLLIDGVAIADPASETFYGMGRMASGIEIPNKGEDYYAIKDVPHGEVRKVRYYSTVLNSWRRLYVYTPPDMMNQMKNTQCFICCMAVAKMKEVGRPRARRI